MEEEINILSFDEGISKVMSLLFIDIFAVDRHSPHRDHWNSKSLGSAGSYLALDDDFRHRAYRLIERCISLGSAYLLCQESRILCESSIQIVGLYSESGSSSGGPAMHATLVVTGLARRVGLYAHGRHDLKR